MPQKFTVKKMTCKCGNKTIKRAFKVNAAGHVINKEAKKVAGVPTKKVQPKKVQPKKAANSKGKGSPKPSPCKCTNPFKGGTPGKPGGK